jgi:hypothetical protein
VLDRRQDVERDAGSTGESEPLYMRPMPGGGYVTVELVKAAVVVSDGGNVAQEQRRRGRVVIEPRGASARRDDAAPLVVEEVEGDDEKEVVAELFRIARDNAAIARRVLRRRAQVRRDD